MLKRGLLRLMRRYGYTALRIDVLEQERSDNARAHHDLLALQGELDAMRASSNALIVERDEIAANLARQNSEIDTVIAQREDAQGEVASLNVRLSNSQTELAEVEARARKLQTDVERHEAGLRRKQMDFDRLSREIDGYRASETQLARQIQDLETRSQVQAEQERRARAVLVSQLDRLKREAAEQQTDLAAREELQAEIERLQQELAAREGLQAEIERLQQELAAREGLQAEIERLQQELAAREGLQAEIERLQQELAAREGLQPEIERLQQELAAREGLQAEIDRLQQELEALRGLQAELENLQEELRKRQEENASIRERFKVSQYSRRIDRAENRRLKDEIEEARATAIENRLRLEQATADLAAAQAREIELSEKSKLQANHSGESDQSLLEQRFLQLIAEHETTLTELAEAYDRIESAQTGWHAENWEGPETVGEGEDETGKAFPKNIVIAGLPYSRANELVTVIQSGGVHQEVQCCSMLFPNDLLNAAAFAGEDQYFANTFLDASPRNLESLKQAAATTIVHIADPRQLLVRRSISVTSQSEEGLPQELGISPALADRRGLSMDKLVDLQIDEFLPCIADWIEAWLNYIDSRPNWPIFLTTDEMLGEETFYADMVGRLGLSAEGLDLTAHTADDVPWQDVLTAEQSAAILAAIPDHIRGRFKWV